MGEEVRDVGQSWVHLSTRNDVGQKAGETREFVHS